MPEGTSNSIVNLGDISKPADTLIKKVSKAVGCVFAPYQLQRMAKAEAKAELIKAETEIQITDLHRRALHRFVEEEAHRQRNIENITARAIPQLTAGAKPDAVEDDWITNFFEKSRIISDSQMQELWSRVLAGEANAPGTFSKRTVNLMSDLDKSDAGLFSNLCNFNWTIESPVPVVFSASADIYNQNGITFESLIHLESIGLIQFDSLRGFAKSRLPKEFVIHYHDRPLLLEMPKDRDNTLEIGLALLTQTGAELAPIIATRPVGGFWEYVLDRWKEHLPKERVSSGASSNSPSTAAVADESPKSS